ncbi:MAG: hypothetical protein AAFY88_26950, partial [Acidobacteriota bacterium]
MTLRFVGELTPSRFGEVGVPTGLWRGERFAALSSEMERLQWPGRSVTRGHTLRHRVSVYDVDFGRRLATFDRAEYPINDVAFHPSAPVALIGTGSYDGGYCFEGELWLWDWEYGDVRRLLGDSRQAVRCRFIDERRAAVLLRPRDEEEFSGDDGDWDASDVFVGLVLDDLRDIRELGIRSEEYLRDPRLEDLEPIDPSSLGFHRVPTFHERRASAIE